MPPRFSAAPPFVKRRQSHLTIAPHIRGMTTHTAASELPISLLRMADGRDRPAAPLG
jgi:hypothetical protein